MSLQPILEATKGTRPTDYARQQIEEFVRQLLVGRKIDAITFVEELLALTLQVGEIHCKPVEDRALCFELAGSDSFEVDLDVNRGKLRMLCARLAVLCHETATGKGDSGNTLMLY